MVGQRWPGLQWVTLVGAFGLIRFRACAVGTARSGCRSVSPRRPDRASRSRPSRPRSGSALPMSERIVRSSALKPSARLTSPAMLSSAFAPRTACGLFDAISRASASASTSGVSLTRVATPSAHGFVAVDHAAGERELLRHVETDDPAAGAGCRSCRGSGPSGPRAPTSSRRARRCGCRRRARSGTRRRARRRARPRSPARGSPATRTPPAGRLVISPPRRGVTFSRFAVAVTCHRLERAEVEAGAERPALAREHHRPHRWIGLQRLPRLDERREERAVERVHLLRPVHPHVSDAVLDACRSLGQT